MIEFRPVNRLDIEELLPYTELNEAQLQHFFEPDGGIFIAESPKVIERALDFGCVRNLTFLSVSAVLMILFLFLQPLKQYLKTSQVFI